MTLNGVMAYMWHIYTSDRIFNPKFKILIVKFLFHYEISQRLRQDLREFGAKNGFRNATFSKFWAKGRGTVFRQDSQKAHSCTETRILVYRLSKSVKKCDL